MRQSKCSKEIISGTFWHYQIQVGMRFELQNILEYSSSSSNVVLVVVVVVDD